MSGQRLAILAKDLDDQRLKLKIYDTRCAPHLSSAIITERDLDRDLAPLTPSGEDEDDKGGCAIAHFSPDGILFGVGRERNIIQVMDSRFASKDLFVYEHEALPEELAGGNGYGVGAMEWLDAEAGPSRSRNVLVSGGDDGEFDISCSVMRLTF